tara:strand:- start:527 stop:697 length:171 start_codon:yes stop_codon:yes gene_type:complete
LTKKLIVDDCAEGCHWIIEQPNGPTSIGTCKFCNNTKEFRNSMPGSGWDRNGQTKK